MSYRTSVQIGSRTISSESETYFIADIASNHDGSLARARELIRLAAEAGADAVKFQHFLAKDIVSDAGFRSLGDKLGHQANWDRSVYETYETYELSRDWTPELAVAAGEAGVDFMTTPYDFAAIELVADLVPAFKIGSGDITWTAIIERIAACGKPTLLATGAATMDDVERAVATALAVNPALVLMQCNTNYTASRENLGYVNLSVLRTYAERWPGMPLGLSDHTGGHVTVLGAIALGARVVEKHFTDDTSRQGPDHPFSMDPETWSAMVSASRDLEAALGDGVKRIEENEEEGAIVQRRCLRLVSDLDGSRTLAASDLVALRPAPKDSLAPHELDRVVGRSLTGPLTAGSALTEADLSE